MKNSDLIRSLIQCLDLLTEINWVLNNFELSKLFGKVQKNLVVTPKVIYTNGYATGCYYDDNELIYMHFRMYPINYLR